LVNEKITNLDEHLSVVLFSCKIAYKVVIGYTPYQLVYGLHLLMLTKYVQSTINGDHKDAEPTKVLTTGITKLKSYKITNWMFKTIWEPTNGTNLCGVNRKILRRSSNLEIMFYGFLKVKKHIWANSRRDGLVHSGYNTVYPIIFFSCFC
jgi:hypothetical protein